MPRKEPVYKVRIKEMSQEEKEAFDDKVALEVANFLMQVLPVEIVKKLVEGE